MPIEKACENCGQLFSSYPSDNRRFCGLQCRSDFRFGKKSEETRQDRVRFSCKECGQGFSMKPSYLTEYRKKYNRDPLYCSRKCSALGRRKTAEQRHAFVCANCNARVNQSRKPSGRLYREQKYCSRECKNEALRKRALLRFEAGHVGRHTKRHGYVWIAVPSLITGKRHTVLEHRYVMSKHLGRELYKEETVHHRDGNRQNNALSNLELFSSRHGPGQRVTDKVTFAIEILRLYPEFAKAAGVELRAIEHL